MLLQFIARRLLYVIPVMVGVSLMTFLMMHVTPGDPVELMLPPEALADEATAQAMRERLGLDQPLHIQYFNFIIRALQGDLGRSIHRQRPVTFLIVRDLPFTIELAATALVIDIVLGLILGVVAAVNAGKLIDTFTVMLSIVGVSMPSFWLGLLAIYTFGVRYSLIPVMGEGGFMKLILPASVLALRGLATLTRVTRSSMLEVLSSDYIRTARAKGLSDRVVNYRHALRNAIIPGVTLLGLRIGAMLAGSVVIETVFYRRGIGSLMIAALNGKDFPLVQGIVLMMAFAYVMANLLVDVMYSLIDPRISYG